MLHSLIIGVGGIVVMMLLWVVVQAIWRRTFAEYVSDEDVLAERRSCGGGSCGCTTACKVKRQAMAPPNQISFKK
ncbi:MAG: hypothetical protein KDC54_21200 [Lewinella sp.]|nr:hypothetical protein [Lewinella sp.]